MSNLQIKLKKCELHLPLLLHQMKCVVGVGLLWLILHRQNNVAFCMAGSEMRESDVAEFASICKQAHGNS